LRDAERHGDSHRQRARRLITITRGFGPINNERDKVMTALTPAERKQAERLRNKAKGVYPVQFNLTKAQERKVREFIRSL